MTVQNSASPSPLRCLQLGLGIGVSADALARLGEIVDIIEIDPLIYEYAVTWFGLQTHADAKVFLEDAHDVIPRLAPNQYHVIMHDVFTGGLMEGSLFTKEFLGSLAKLLKPNGVLGMASLYLGWCWIEVLKRSSRMSWDRSMTPSLPLSTEPWQPSLPTSGALVTSLSMSESETLQVEHSCI